MSLSTSSLLVPSLIALHACGCAGTTPTPSSSAPLGADARGTSRSNAGAPLHVTLSEAHTLASGDIVLRARIERLAPLHTPLDVTVRVPATVVWVRGDRAYRLATSATADIDEREIVIRTGAPPPAVDLVLEVDAHGDGSGIHAESRYRFGRAEPALPHPSPTGAAIIVNGRDLGRAVPATPNTLRP